VCFLVLTCFLAFSDNVEKPNEVKGLPWISYEAVLTELLRLRDLVSLEENAPEQKKTFLF
jgi:hypothetical protein